MNNESAHNVLRALHNDRVGTLTKQALVRAFNDDGIVDLEGMAERMLKRINNDIELQKTEPRPLEFRQLGKITPIDTARDIVHVPPEVSFVLDGVEFDPQDIHRFNGEALVFMPVVGADGSTSLQVFHEDIKPLVTAYFQLQQIGTLITPKSFQLPGVPDPQPGTPPGQSQPGEVSCGRIYPE